jgi:hypothetical protein
MFLYAVDCVWLDAIAGDSRSERAGTNSRGRFDNILAKVVPPSAHLVAEPIRVCYKSLGDHVYPPLTFSARRVCQFGPAGGQIRGPLSLWQFA